jgi:hypothetical protein
VTGRDGRTHDHAKSNEWRLDRDVLGADIGRRRCIGRAKSRHLFRDFLYASASIEITGRDLVVRFQKRAHNPLLVAAGFETTDVAVPWLAGKRLRLIFS